MSRIAQLHGDNKVCSDQISGGDRDCSKGYHFAKCSYWLRYLGHGDETTLLTHPAEIIANLAQSHQLGTGLRGVTSWKSARRNPSALQKGFTVNTQNFKQKKPSINYPDVDFWMTMDVSKSGPSSILFNFMSKSNRQFEL